MGRREGEARDASAERDQDVRDGRREDSAVTGTFGWYDGLVRLVLDIVDVPVCLADPHGVVIGCNVAAEVAWGLKVGDATGEALRGVLRADRGDHMARLPEPSCLGPRWEGKVSWPGVPGQGSVEVSAVALLDQTATVVGALCFGSPLGAGEDFPGMDAVSLLTSMQIASPAPHMILDLSGRYLRVNDALLAMNGGTRAERIGRPITEVQPDVADSIMAAVSQVATTRQPLRNQRLEGEVSASPGHRRIWRMAYYPVVSRGGSINAVGVICEDITEAQHASRHLAAVSQVAAALLDANTLDEVLHVVLRAVPAEVGASTASVVLEDPRVPALRRCRLGDDDGSPTVRWDPAPPGAEALLTGEGEAVAAPTDASTTAVPLRRPAPTQLVLRLTGTPGARSILVLGFPPDAAVDPSTHRLLTDLATQCATAIERARSFELAQASADLTCRLQQATARLADSFSEEQIGATVVAEARGGLGANGGGFGVVDRRRHTHRFVALSGWDQLDLGDMLAERPLDGTSLSAECLRRRSPLYASTPEALGQYLPAERVERAVRLGNRQAWAAVPVSRGGDADAVGTVTLSFPTPRRLSEEERAFLSSLAGQGAAAIERVRRIAADHQIAAVLQRALLPERLPDVPGLTVAVRYESGAEGTQVGGDWYDAFFLEGGEVALVIGDVAGHDLAAAGVMGQLRAQLRACARSGLDAGQTLGHLDHVLRRSGSDIERFATAVLAIWHPSESVLDVAVAGHPSPLFLDTSGGHYLTSLPGPPLGVGLGDVGFPHERVHIDPHAATTMVLFTDGLVERPGEHLGDALRSLRTSIPQPAHADPNDLVEYLVEMRRPPGGWLDDVAVLACRFDPPATAAD